MKKSVLVLILISNMAFGQDAIFNVHKQNLHLLNYAYKTNAQLKVSFDNTNEYYHSSTLFINNRVFNTSRLDINYSINRQLNVGLDLGYEFKNGMKCFNNIDAFATYNLVLTRNSCLSISLNAGALNSQFDSAGIYKRYTNSEFQQSDFNIDAQNLNVGFGSVFYYKKNALGFSANYLNKPHLPVEKGEDIPIKYTAYLRSILINRKLISTIIYQSQDKYLYNNIDMDYYFNMMSYLGVNLEYNIMPFTFGLGAKSINNGSSMYSANLGLSFFEVFDIFYSFSLMQDSPNTKLARFHQLGLYYSIQPLGGKTRFRDPCPAF
ncbi:MAG: type IX secretion system membrane protein PorP/SprF [Saprospiraceae bacterium]|nr:type IX secretion system membrane protein PorP/SprF [Saprospiraceae bacterium]